MDTADLTRNHPEYWAMKLCPLRHLESYLDQLFNLRSGQVLITTRRVAAIEAAPSPG